MLKENARLILGLSVTVVIILFWVLLKEQRYSDTLSKEIAQLNDEVKTLKSNWQKERRELEVLRSKEPVLLPETDLIDDGAETRLAEQNIAVATEESLDNAEDTTDEFVRRATQRAQIRTNVIGSFVELSENQRERLKKKFIADAKHVNDNAPPARESLEDIIGAENAAYYRKQRQKAFDRGEVREIEKEVLYLSRQLSLSKEQEEFLRDTMFEIDSEVEERMKSFDNVAEGSRRTPRQKLMYAVEKNRLEKDILTERLQHILSAEQYRLHQKLDAESPSTDLEMWHGTSTNN